MTLGSTTSLLERKNNENSGLRRMLKTEIEKKRPHLKKKKVLFHQDNAPSHTSAVAMAKIHEFQHVASLNALGVDVGSEILVNIIESKLPKNTAEKWEETLGRDEFPKIDELYEFLCRTAVHVSKRVRSETVRLDDKNPSSAKKPRITNKAFISNAVNSCIACKNKQHPLYKCEKFKQLDASKRIELVRNARLCYNCMRSHRGKPCNYANCTICQKRHNTLLHLDKYSSAAMGVNTAD
ncbi:hypothetical protein ALC57_18371 [Trachymyrmex cornetzi]|uniref:Uncharacterized protein n=1 Tax=Trachymyrmex cornetzi TaxID=471704 RepID=A0A151IS15_9HYME|nr:hypothetical protein ALC57_18371 [Trachymyrmex cornetzi]